MTGLKRWKMRQSSRTTLELSDDEKWECPQGCGQVYRVSSSRSIQKHTVTCKRRSSVEPTKDADCSSDDSDDSPRALVADGEEGQQGEDLKVGQSESKLERSVSLRRMPAQFDGFQEDTQFGQDMDESGNAFLRGSSSVSISPFHTLPSSNFTSTLDWEGTPIRRLLRRQQLEIEHLSAQHFMEVVAMRDQSAIALHNSALRFGVQALNGPPS